jgi:predicted DNA-binding mobile mystery protein A
MPARGWLRAVREAVGLTQGSVAARASVKRQSYSQFETAEEKGTITLGSLRRAAEAMDCELVYFLIPKESVSSTYLGLTAIHDPVARQLQATEHSLSLGGRAALMSQGGSSHKNAG